MIALSYCGRAACAKAGCIPAGDSPAGDIAAANIAAGAIAAGNIAAGDIFIPPASAQTAAMRIAFLFCLLLGGCVASPQSLGITGPGTQSAAPAATSPATPNDPLDNPATLNSGTRYGPTYTPSTTGGSPYWGYD